MAEDVPDFDCMPALMTNRFRAAGSAQVVRLLFADQGVMPETNTNARANLVMGYEDAKALRDLLTRVIETVDQQVLTQTVQPGPKPN